MVWKLLWYTLLTTYSITIALLNSEGSGEHKESVGLSKLKYREGTFCRGIQYYTKVHCLGKMKQSTLTYKQTKNPKHSVA